MWAIAIVGCVIGALWVRPKSKAPAQLVVPKASANVTPKHIEQFIDAYEERDRLLSDLKSLEARAQKGRIPRRRYKVQRKTWEQRLATLEHEIRDLKAILSSAGGSLADFVRQLERAEVELSEVDLETKTLENRHATGEIPLDEYRKHLGDLEKRKKKAESSVSGVLLRLREEMR